MSGELLALLRWSECHEEVSRRGEAQPCEKPAVALHRDPEGGTPYPVCGYHARGSMFTLAELRAAASSGREVGRPGTAVGVGAGNSPAPTAQ